MNAAKTAVLSDFRQKNGLGALGIKHFFHIF